MKIQSINSAFSSIAKAARNTVAAGLVAASPMAAKTASAEGQVFAKTNLVEATSSAVAKQMTGNGKYYCFMSTNNLPDTAEIVAYRFTSPADHKITAVANGEVRVGKILGGQTLEELKTDPKIVDNFFVPGNIAYEPNTATKVVMTVPEGDTSNRFFKVVFNQDKGSAEDLTGINEWQDANGATIRWYNNAEQQWFYGPRTDN